MSVKVVNNIVKVNEQINSDVIAWLYEAGGELVSQIERNYDEAKRVDTGDTKTSYEYEVDESRKECTVGSGLMNAIWEEFGTGRYAENGDGRKGYWVYVKNSTGNTSEHNKDGKSYSLYEAQEICAYLREQGLDAYYTCGKHGHRPLRKAFEDNKEKIQKSLEDKLKG